MSHTNSQMPADSPKYILIVEDDAEIGRFLTEAIKQETPHRAALAVDGTQALELLRQTRPDLFICDYRLPDIDGFTLYEVVRAMENFDEVPVILISAMPGLMNIPVEHNKLLRLQKPIELDEFLYLVNTLLASALPSDR